MVAIGKRECITLPPQWIALTGSFHGWWQQWGSRWLVNRHWRISSLNFCSTSETLALRGYFLEENAEMEPQLTYIFTYIFNQWNMCVMCSVWIISRNKLLLYRNCIYTVESRHLITEYLHLHLHFVHCVFRDNISISQNVSATTRPSHHLTFPGRLEQLH